MKADHRKRILLLVTNEFAAMNVIHSGLIGALAREYDVHIFSDFIKAGEIGEINVHFGIEVKSFDHQLPVETRMIRTLRRIEKALFFSHFRIKTQQIKDLGEKSRLKYLRKLILKIVAFFGVSLFLVSRLRKMIIVLTRNGSMKKHLQTSTFDGIISSSPFDIRENQVVNDMKVPALAMVISWDNLTTKGLINAEHDRLLVWNKFMAAEYQKFHKPISLNEEKVCITGIPRFDIYFKDEIHPTSELDFKKKFGMAAHDKFILFATSAAKHFPNQIEIVNHLIAHVRRKPNLKIIVRCHPGDDASLYQSFETNGHVKVWAPAPIKTSWSDQLSEGSPLLSLAQMLKYCEVCVNVASTLRLDAAACNRPVVSIAYDGDLTLPYRNSVKRLYAYSHQIPLNELNLDVMVFSKAGLFDALDTILAEDSSTALNYKKGVKEFTHFSEPDSIRTTMNVIREWLN